MTKSRSDQRQDHIKKYRQSKNIKDLRDPKKMKADEAETQLLNNYLYRPASISRLTKKTPIKSQYKPKDFNTRPALDTENDPDDGLDYVNNQYSGYRAIGGRTNSQTRAESAKPQRAFRKPKMSNSSSAKFFKHVIKDNK